MILILENTFKDFASKFAEKFLLHIKENNLDFLSVKYIMVKNVKMRKLRLFEIYDV